MKLSESNTSMGSRPEQLKDYDGPIPKAEDQEFESVNAVVEPLSNHELVYDVLDVSLDGSVIIIVQFDTITLPTAILESDKYRVRSAWVGTVPPWYLKWAKDWALKRGVGNRAIAAELEVEFE